MHKHICTLSHMIWREICLLFHEDLWLSFGSLFTLLGIFSHGDSMFHLNPGLAASLTYRELSYDHDIATELSSHSVPFPPVFMAHILWGSSTYPNIFIHSLKLPLLSFYLLIIVSLFRLYLILTCLPPGILLTFYQCLHLFSICYFFCLESSFLAPK